MNAKPALRLVVVEVITMVKNIFISISLLVPQPCCHFLHLHPCSCLQMGNFVVVFVGTRSKCTIAS